MKEQTSTNLDFECTLKARREIETSTHYEERLFLMQLFRDLKHLTIQFEHLANLV